MADLIIGAGYVLGTIAILKSNGMDPGSVVATSAVVSGVLALSLQATLGNILGGVALQLDHSLHAGDWIQLPDGTQGKVREVHWRHTVVETRNWDTLSFRTRPSSPRTSSSSASAKGRPFSTGCGSTSTSISATRRASVIAVVQDALRAVTLERVAMDPPPNVICYDFAKDGRDSFGYYAVPLLGDAPRRRRSDELRGPRARCTRRSGARASLSPARRRPSSSPRTIARPRGRAARHRAERSQLAGSSSSSRSPTRSEPT